jgi:hypothetical protein
MSTARPERQKLLGLFELDTAGKVIYARVESNEGAGQMMPSVSGRNFFEEVAPFDNVEELRRHINQFVQGTSPADHFNFNCRYGDGALPVRVLLARLRERTNDAHTQSILVHIRKVA